MATPVPAEAKAKVADENVRSAARDVSRDESPGKALSQTNGKDN